MTCKISKQNRSRKIAIKLRGLTYSLILSLLSVSFPSIPVVAANRIIFTYGPLELPVDLDSLSNFANFGTSVPELLLYLNQVNPQQQADFRTALTKRHQLNPTQVARFFNSDLGEDLLTFLGQYIKIESGSNGNNALRTAIIQASRQREGLSVIDIFNNLPTNVKIDGEKLFSFIKYTNLIFKSSILTPKLIGELSTKEAVLDDSTDFSEIADLRQNGTFEVQEEKWILEDQSRARSFYVLVYKPQQLQSQRTPVVIISHGLAGRPEDSEKRARYLASYGYVVAVPQHHGSDHEHIQSVLNGKYRDFIPVNEFIDRPLDITFLIDEIERRNDSEFAGQLDHENVGVLGHSFGGYTALALAGAEIDFKFLEKDCENKFDYLDLSRLLQCKALNLPKNVGIFRDPRVKAIVLRNAINRSIFGPVGLSKVKVPVVYFSGSYDTLAHPMYEQIYPFIWLQTPDKYLGLEEGQAHADSVGLNGSLFHSINSVTDVIFPKPETLAVYKNTTILAFFKVYLNQNLSYRPYLQSSYAAYLSNKEPFKFYWISADSVAELENDVRNLTKREGLPEL